MCIVLAMDDAARLGSLRQCDGNQTVVKAQVFSFDSNYPTGADLALAHKYWRGMPPTKNQGNKPLWDPKDENNPDRSELYTDGSYQPAPVGCGSVHLMCPDSSMSQETFRSAGRLLAIEPAMIDRLSIGFQPYTVKLQEGQSNPTRWPGGFDQDWLQSLSVSETAPYEDVWNQSGREFAPWRSVAAVENATGRFAPGWVTVSADTVAQYTVQPDLRDADYRTWCAREMVRHAERAGVRSIHLALKAEWFVDHAAPVSTPEDPVTGPWLPSQYPGNEYLYATSALAREVIDLGVEVNWRDSSGYSFQALLDVMPEDSTGCDTVWQPTHLRSRGFDECDY